MKKGLAVLMLMCSFTRVCALVEGECQKPYQIAQVSKGSSWSKKESALIKRIISFYHNTYNLDLGPAEGLWLYNFAEIKLPVHNILIEGDEKKVANLLHYPAQSALFYGFDNLASPLDPKKMEENKLPAALGVFNDLRLLAIAAGAARLMNPEQPPEFSLIDLPCTSENIENILLALDKIFGFKIDFPTPYPGEVGLATSRGIASYRAIQALYQAWRCAQLVDNPCTSSVLEIGGGLGRAAYYAHKFGFKNYTIVDLPITIVAQAHFLASTLGQDSVNLYGENRKEGITLLPPYALFSKDVPYDLIVNVDGLTELSLETAKKYWKYIEHNTPLFLSVNHETNAYTVRDLYTLSKCQLIMRSPYWLRKGYTEEIIKFPGSVN